MVQRTSWDHKRNLGTRGRIQNLNPQSVWSQGSSSRQRKIGSRMSRCLRFQKNGVQKHGRVRGELLEIAAKFGTDSLSFNPPNKLLRLPPSERVALIRDAVRRNLHGAHETSAISYNRKTRMVRFRSGQEVFRRNFVLSDFGKNFNAKFARKFLKCRIRRGPHVWGWKSEFHIKDDQRGCAWKRRKSMNQAPSRYGGTCGTGRRRQMDGTKRGGGVKSQKQGVDRAEDRVQIGLLSMGLIQWRRGDCPFFPSSFDAQNRKMLKRVLWPKIQPKEQ